MEYAICTVAAAPVRKEPSHKSEMVNQLLFGETMEVIAVQKEWVHIKSLFDGYEGWLTYHLINDVDEKTAGNGSECITSHLINPLQMPDGYGAAMIPMGSFLTGYNSSTKKLWDDRFSYEGAYVKRGDSLEIKELVDTALSWLHVPYLWGGKTLMGVDCSGFVQTVFKVFGFRLLRDAYQQAAQGEEIEQLSQAQPGDVAFFYNEEGKIIHVGILLNEDKIVHASGKVRIDTITKEGIFNTESKKQTHALSCIRRMTGTLVPDERPITISYI